jgi:hypothetical protein
VGLLLCMAAFVTAYFSARRTLGAALVTLLAVGYGYGILRANFPDGLSHFMFDAAALGVYLGHFSSRAPGELTARSREAGFWLKVLAIVPLVMFLLPLQHPLVQLIGLRAALLFLPMVVLGARLSRKDVTAVARGLAVLDLAALGFGIAEYFLGVAAFFPRNEVTQIMFRSADVGVSGYLRIPSTFSSAHAYGGTMLASLPLVAELWITSRRRTDRVLGAAALIASALGIFLCAARLPVIMLALLAPAALAGQGLSGKRKLTLVLGAAAVIAFTLSNERLQRFRTLEGRGYVSSRFEGSTNDRLLELVEKYPFGAGLARANGTSIPFFLQQDAAPQIGLENEFSRIVIEEGVIGLALWLAFVVWTATRSPPGDALSPLGLRLARVGIISSWGTGLIGTGLLTAIPGTALMLLQMGLLARGRGDAPAPSVVQAAPARGSLA